MTLQRSSVSDTLAAVSSDLTQLREQVETLWRSRRSIYMPSIAFRTSLVRRPFRAAIRDLSTRLSRVDSLFIPPLTSSSPCDAVLDAVDSSKDYIKLKINLLFLRNWRYAGLEGVLEICSSARRIEFKLVPLGAQGLAVLTSGPGILVLAVIGVGLAVWVVRFGTRSQAVAIPAPASAVVGKTEDGRKSVTFSPLLEDDSGEYLSDDLDIAPMRPTPLPGLADGGPTPGPIPHHELLLSYIHPMRSNWPPAYLQAFDRAAKSQAQVGGMTHVDTKPSANTRSKGRETAEKWNGKVVLSMRGVREDLRAGRIGLREGVVLDEGGLKVSHSLLWQVMSDEGVHAE